LRPKTYALDFLQNGGDAHTAANTSGSQRILAFTARQQQRGLTRNPSTGSAERVAKCNRAAFDIHPRRITSKLVDARNRLCRKGFVQLDDVDVFNVKASPCECFLARRDWPQTHDARLKPYHRRRFNP